MPTWSQPRCCSPGAALIMLVRHFKDPFDHGTRLPLTLTAASNDRHTHSYRILTGTIEDLPDSRQVFSSSILATLTTRLWFGLIDPPVCPSVPSTKVGPPRSERVVSFR